MTRAARGGSPAVFKVIRNGGCQSPAQLRAQLAYVTTKSCFVFDARGRFDGLRSLDSQQIEEATQRFVANWRAGRQLHLGHTTHLLLSFPVRTSPELVGAVAEAVCAEFLQRDGAHFDYIAAIHTDRDHPHAHVIVNRRSAEGGLFTLRPDGPYSYQAFREGMVAHGARLGLSLEATRRLDRGKLTYAARDGEVRQAREQGRAPVERQRIGRDLDRAIQDVALARSTYRGLAAEASRAGFDDVGDALLKASAVLARNGIILPAKEITLAYDPDGFETLLKEFGETMRRVEERIDRAAPADRPRLEQGLNEILASVAHLNPLGHESGSLQEEPSPIGLYSRMMLADAQLDRLDSPRVTAELDTALRGTGLSTAEVVERLRIGAQNAALERQWIGNDARLVAGQEGLDLNRTGDVERVIDRLDAIQAKVEVVLRQEGVLRTGPAAAAARASDLQARSLGVEAVSPAAKVVQREALSPTTSRGEVAEDDVDQVEDRTRRLLEVASRLRQADPDARAFTSAIEAAAFCQEVEGRLDPEQIARLARGDADALSAIVEAPIDRLTLAKSYLEARGVPGSSAPHRAVALALAHAQLDAKRERLAHEDGGPVHG